MKKKISSNQPNIMTMFEMGAKASAEKSLRKEKVQNANVNKNETKLEKDKSPVKSIKEKSPIKSIKEKSPIKENNISSTNKSPKNKKIKINNKVNDKQFSDEDEASPSKKKKSLKASKSPDKVIKNPNKNNKKKVIDDDEEVEFDDRMDVEESEFTETITKNNKKAKTKSNKKYNDIDSEEMEIINQQFEELEQLEKKDNKKNKTKGSSRKTNIKKEAEDLKTSSTAKKNNIKNDLPEVVGELNGLTFVITGVFNYSRDDLTNLIKALGGRATGSVTGKTDYLLIGHILEDGREVHTSKKYKEAQAKKVKMMNEGEFLDYLKEKLGDSSFDIKAYLDSKGENVQIGKVAPNEEKKKDDKMEVDDVSINRQDLWTTKHAPTDFSEVIGNQKTINQFITWLDDWEDVVLNGNKKDVEGSWKGGRGVPLNPNAKACLISGDPGIGKTTIVRLVAKLKGYITYEQNASDQRNKNIIANRLGFLFDNKTLFAGQIQGKNLIIMDEVDGMGGNEDRGGIAALIEIVKKTKTPIVCIANDKTHPKLRSLINHCYDLKFNKPDKRLVVNRLRDICQKENMIVEDNALELLCENSGNDIRQCLNFLEFWSRKFSKLSYLDLNNRHKTFDKDSITMMSNFDAAKKLLDRKDVNKYTFREKLNLYFIDYDLIPLLIHENYLACYSSKDKNKEQNIKDLKSIIKSSEHISVGDILEKKIRVQQEWGLLQNKGIHSALAVGQYSANFIAFPKFPDIMGKFQKIRKVKREIRELKYSFPGVSSTSLKEEVAPLIMSKVTNYLAESGSDGVDSVLEFMKAYKISLVKLKENIFDLAEEKISNKFEKLGTSTKSALTRKYNEINKSSVTHKRRKEKEESNIKYDDEGNIIEENQDENEANEDDESSLVEVKQGGKAKQAKGAKSTKATKTAKEPKEPKAKKK